MVGWDSRFNRILDWLNVDHSADVNAALNILAAALAVSARGGSGITPAREPRTQPRDRPLHAGSTGIPVKMTFVI